MLVLQRRIGERIIVGDGDERIVITLIDIRDGGRKARIGLDAPDHIRIDREEIRGEKDSGRGPAA